MPIQVINNDFGFVGQAYSAPDPRQDNQILVNWYPEISLNKMKSSKTIVALLGTPGLVKVASAVGL